MTTRHVLYCRVAGQVRITAVCVSTRDQETAHVRRKCLDRVDERRRRGVHKRAGCEVARLEVPPGDDGTTATSELCWALASLSTFGVPGEFTCPTTRRVIVAWVARVECSHSRSKLSSAGPALAVSRSRSDGFALASVSAAIKHDGGVSTVASIVAVAVTLRHLPR